MQFAATFGIAGVLLMRFSAQTTAFLESVATVEQQHAGKADARSSTSHRTAEPVAAARRELRVRPAPAATSSGLAGARDADIGGVPVHAVRLLGLVAHQDVLLAGAGESLTTRHDSYDQGTFMLGVLLGVRPVASGPGLTVGLDPLVRL